MPVRIEGRGRKKETYALLDGGASNAVITGKLATELGLETTQKSTVLYTVEGATRKRRNYVDFKLSNLSGQYEAEVEQAVIMDFITAKSEKPPRNSDISNLEYLRGVKFEELDHDDIEVIIPAELNEIWVGRPYRRSTRRLPVAIETACGWTLLGGGADKGGEEESCFRTIIEEDNKGIHELVEKIYSSDFPTITKNEIHLSDNDKHAIEQLKETVRFDEETGHYVSGVLYKGTRDEAMEKLNAVDSANYAKTRTRKAVEKVRRMGGENLQYLKNQMSGIFDDGHAEFINPEDVPDDVPKWVLPLHVVFHPNKPTKPRCCHDAKAMLQGVSLNSLLLTGPDLLNRLLGVLFKFRRHEVTVSADIKGFFHQVYVYEKDKYLFQFYWYVDADLREPKLCYIKVHTFGAKSSPTVSTYVLRHHATLHKDEISPETLEAIMEMFYVDDFLGSYEKEDTARKVRVELTELLKKGGFELVKWNSNRPKVLESGEERDEDKEIKETDPQTETIEKVLGVKYSFGKDKFFFEAKKEKLNVEVKTKRGMLKALASMYDPLGIVSPYILEGKLLLSGVMKDKKLGWDNLIGKDTKKNFEKFLKGVEALSQYTIDRWLNVEITKGVVPTLQVFCDSSKVAYGFVFYRRVQAEETVVIRFLFAKSRLIPANAEKTRHHESIPRFELTAAKAASDMYEEICKEAGEEYGKVYFWSDSKTTLNWIRNRSIRPDTFMQNRISVIRAKTNIEDWHFVPTKENPADHSSRGIKATDTETWDIFLNGPLFLRSPDWVPPDKTLTEEETAGEEEVTINAVVEKIEEKSWVEEITERRETWARKIRLLARVRRCARKWKTKKNAGRNGKIPELKNEELREAEQIIIRDIQERHFNPELKVLRREKIYSPRSRKEMSLKTSRLRKLNIFLDKDNIARAGTRLVDYEKMSYNSRCPIVLPKEDKAVSAIIQQTHTMHGHMGANFTRNALRKKFAILDDGQATKKVIHRCVQCQKNFKQPVNQQMGELPEERISPGYAFECSGADVFGPFEIRGGKKGKEKLKKYCLIFTCLKTRGVHFEPIDSISAPALINALIRFTARRPGVKKIFSDCGRNFVGAEKLIEEALKAADQKTGHEIEWVQIAPKAPFRGGIWERLIKETKKILVSLLGKEDANNDIFITVIAQAEAILNNRPLTHVSEDPSDLEALTPASLMHPGTEQWENPVLSRMEPWESKEMRHMHQKSINLIRGFWRRWSSEYLNTLRHRQKWTKNEKDVETDQLVLMVDECKQRKDWKLGRVVEAEKSERDGKVRTVKVRTANGRTVRRATGKVVALELE